MSLRDLVILGCSSQQPTRHRNQGGYLLRWNNEGILLDPGEGTQRQFIFADVAPPVVTRILISHFHGDHCLGVGSMLMRLNLDNVTHPIHCYYPASGKKYFDRLCTSCIYRKRIQIVEHPVAQEGVVEEGNGFRIEAAFLDHGVENIGWRIQEPDAVRFSKEKLAFHQVRGPMVKELEQTGRVLAGNRWVALEEVSSIQPGAIFAYVMDTRVCKEAIALAKDATMLLCESTYLDEERDLAYEYGHMTALQAAKLAKQAGAEMLILTHFSARYPDGDVLAAEARTVFPNTFAAADCRRFALAKRPIV